MRFCTLCSPEWFHNVNAIRGCDLLASEEVLKCSICNMFACKKCITNAMQFIQESKKINPSSFILSSKKWYEDTNMYLMQKEVPEDFVGHCCIIKQDVGENPKSNHETTTSANHTKLGGALFFPEYKILIDSPKGVIDVHALGKESTFSAVWHCVLPPDGKHAVPRNIKSSIKSLRKIFEVPIPNRVDFGKACIQFEACIFIVPRVSSLDVSRKGSNDVSQKEIGGSMFVNDKSYPYPKMGSRHRILLVIGNDGPLLLCRFLDHKCKMSETEQTKLFDHLCTFLRNDATERMRYGGSSGNINSATMSNIRRLLSCRTNAPRRPRGVIWLLSNLKIELVYLSPRSYVFVSHKYSLPVPGGNFSINEDQIDYILKRYKDIANFMLRKIDTAYILEKLNKELEFDIQIAPEAMKEEFDRIHKAKIEMLDCLSNDTSVSNDTRKNVFLQKYSKHICFTLVIHPVGFHQDNFSQKNISYSGLENKVIYSHLKQVGYGRGGLGNNFAWALLDWPK